MKKGFIFSLIVFCSFRIQSQNEKVDTVFFKLEKFKKIDNITIHNLIFKDNTFSLVNVENKGTEDSKTVFFKHKTSYSYFIFMTLKGYRIEEGRWNGEHFMSGIYKEYYKNGKVKAVGNIDDGNKIGTWYYYNKKGKQVKQKTFAK